MERGLYESLITAGLQDRLASLHGLRAEIDALDVADQPHVLSRHLQTVIERALSATKDPTARLKLVNGLLDHLSEIGDLVSDPPRQLLRLVDESAFIQETPDPARPRTPLSDAALLTNAHGEPSLGAELRAELDTSDTVDLLCAFVKWHGLRLLDDELARLRRRGVPFRVVTTTYMGATERAALDRLVQEFGAQVKIQYDAQRTRLHAKAWMFRRSSGFDTARRSRVERAIVAGRHSRAAGEVPGDLRHLLERQVIRELRPSHGSRPPR